MLVAWITVIQQQVAGQYFCVAVRVQFGDEFLPALGTFSGLYDMRTVAYYPFSKSRVEYAERRSVGPEQRGKFAYCSTLGAWTFRWEDSNAKAGQMGPCDWVARSEKTASFDFLDTSSSLWFVRDVSQREVSLTPFYLACFECYDTDNSCGRHGTCGADGVCLCEGSWYGLRCEFGSLCTSLSIDSQSDSFVSTRDWASDYGVLRGINGTVVEAYHRPVFVHFYDSRRFDLILFTGRRWALTPANYLPLKWDGNDTKAALITYIKKGFIAHAPNISFSFLSDPADFGTATDALAPIGLTWYRARTSVQHGTEFDSYVPDKVVGTVLLCQVRDDRVNPCLFDGECVDGSCLCSPGSSGDMCQTPPIGNGFCNQYFNTPEFQYDGTSS